MKIIKKTQSQVQKLCLLSKIKVNNINKMGRKNNDDDNNSKTIENNDNDKNTIKLCNCYDCEYVKDNCDISDDTFEEDYDY